MPLSPQTVSKLQALLARRRRLEADHERTADELFLETLRASEVERASRTEIARALGVGTSTVQGWVVRGRRLRDG
jgi:DNA-directed RNA polymerase specialized sigma24 family protein